MTPVALSIDVQALDSSARAGRVAIYVADETEPVQDCSRDLLDDWVGHDLGVDVRVAAWQVELEVEVSVVFGIESRALLVLLEGVAGDVAVGRVKVVAMGQAVIATRQG